MASFRGEAKGPREVQRCSAKRVQARCDLRERVGAGHRVHSRKKEVKCPSMPPAACSGKQRPQALDRVHGKKNPSHAFAPAWVLPPSFPECQRHGCGRRKTEKLKHRNKETRARFRNERAAAACIPFPLCSKSTCRPATPKTCRAVKGSTGGEKQSSFSCNSPSALCGPNDTLPDPAASAGYRKARADVVDPKGSRRVVCRTEVLATVSRGMHIYVEEGFDREAFLFADQQSKERPFLYSLMNTWYNFTSQKPAKHT